MAQAVRHTTPVRNIRVENELKREQLASGLMSFKNALAQHLSGSLMPKTGLMRLRRLKEAHAVSGASDTHDGKAIWNQLVAFREKVGMLEETRAHDRAVELMRDTALADGCPAQAFADKVNELMRDHVPWLERPL